MAVCEKTIQFITTDLSADFNFCSLYNALVNSFISTLSCIHSKVIYFGGLSWTHAFLYFAVEYIMQAHDIGYVINIFNTFKNYRHKHSVQSWIIPESKALYKQTAFVNKENVFIWRQIEMVAAIKIDEFGIWIVSKYTCIYNGEFNRRNSNGRRWRACN